MAQSRTTSIKTLSLAFSLLYSDRVSFPCKCSLWSASRMQNARLGETSSVDRLGMPGRAVREVNLMAPVYWDVLRDVLTDDQIKLWPNFTSSWEDRDKPQRETLSVGESKNPPCGVNCSNSMFNQWQKNLACAFFSTLFYSGTRAVHLLAIIPPWVMYSSTNKVRRMHRNAANLSWFINILLPLYGDKVVIYFGLFIWTSFYALAYFWHETLT